MNKSIVVAVSAASLMIGCVSGNAPKLEVPPPEPLTGISEPQPADPSVTLAPPPSRAPLAAIRATPTVRFHPEEAQSLAEVQSVTVSWDVQNLFGTANFAVEMFANEGLPYERRSFVVEGAGRETTTVSFELAVAGTVIEQSQLVGSWEAKLFLDNEAVASSTFEIMP